MNILSMNRDARVTRKTAFAVAAVGVVAILLYLSPYFLWGQDSHVLIGDYLDEIPHWRLLHTENPFWRSGRPDEAFMRGSMPSYVGPDLRGDTWAYYFFSPFTAFLVNEASSRLVAFAGMFLLVRALLAGHKRVTFIALGTAVLFSLINHHPWTPFTVPVLPWIAYSVLQVHRRQDRWWHWAALCLAPFFSFFLYAPFFC